MVFHVPSEPPGVMKQAALPAESEYFSDFMPRDITALSIGR